ncbi:hypothetical protein NDU88_008575 [Pleurodeles waltl]|uniref:Uncharacterized protein n=1 Tax=Pleurodeles waltl TaxID=8319 RepID=A0AAV7NWG1_PLEWA|nr:hypothetical protein NDU88_008575 [Pleurodeles waltl]
MRPAAAHPRLRWCRTPPVHGSRAVTPPSWGNGPSPAPAGSRSSSAVPQGIASPRDARPGEEPGRASHPSPPAIPLGSASPGDSRPALEAGEAGKRLPTASLHQAWGKSDGADGAHVRSAMLLLFEFLLNVAFC